MFSLPGHDAHMDMRLIAMALAALLLPVQVAASEHHDRDHDRAREAVAAGQRQPLAAILRQVEARFGGRVLEIELDEDHGRTIYEIELLDEQGRVLELEVDAATGEILQQEYDD